MLTAAAEVYNSYYKRFRTVGAIVVKTSVSVYILSQNSSVGAHVYACGFLWVFGKFPFPYRSRS